MNTFRKITRYTKISIKFTEINYLINYNQTITIIYYKEILLKAKTIEVTYLTAVKMI